MRQTSRHRSRPLYQNHRDFLHRELTIADIVGGNPEFAHLKAMFYCMLWPYITGLLFIFTVVAKGSFHDLFTIIAKSDWLATFMIWAIGYEILASLFVGWFFYTLFSLKKENKR
jgi:hypothetical protein